ncbi:MAG: DUF2442 domain-containing protein [Candidatus Devosia phytovorans]|uniref:DUF2442 domain-containing protein n=1 Tax=Candidatus Devosia phytovorans TaxID=3121372 RepID=A0AAJ5VUR8_9HYPH|nr:DUF2442 domain-containing protein [Devosia sp.]WEK05246.1 MAG: DUF2442 domain-containing protein [Devosia sp.]
MTDIEYVDVVAVKALPDFHLWVRFSNGHEGVRDFRPLIAEGGPMAAQLRDAAVFNGVYVNDDVPAWPNGYEIDATNLHLKMMQEGLLIKTEAAE